MKLAYKHITSSIKSSDIPTIDDISKKLFQLGHENEIQGDILDIDITPNRGDCLSLNGILRDLSVFYDINLDRHKYQKPFKDLNLNFVNKVKKYCPRISFLKIEIDHDISDYKGDLKSYFDLLETSKNNFFTDISNFISYETGQPTHTYDFNKLSDSIILDEISKDIEFNTLLDSRINLNGKNTVFLSKGEVINLAGIMGGKNTRCSKETKTVLIECAYFIPKIIVGKALKYDINSDAAHKFERGTDPLCHEDILRRFIQIVEDHATINKIEYFSEVNEEYEHKKIDINVNLINKILDTSLKESEYINYLNKLGFSIDNGSIIVPSHRSDIFTQNDLSEEIARSMGYDNLVLKEFTLKNNNVKEINTPVIDSLKSFLYENGFFEVINNPFTHKESNSSINIDNPLDTNKSYIRTSLKDSLLDNLAFNERRQKESIKLFEISDLYYIDDNKIHTKKVIGIIASGRVGFNYNDFSKKMNLDYLKNLFTELSKSFNFNFEILSRDNIDSKSKDEIIFTEIELSKLDNVTIDYDSNQNRRNNFNKYEAISEFPSSARDLSFASNCLENLIELENEIYDFKDPILKKVFTFDFFKNNKTNEFKLGFRFIFQSNDRTLTDKEIDKVINVIIDKALLVKSIKIPGLK